MKGVETELACQALVFFPVGGSGSAIALLAYLEAVLAHSSRFRHLSGQLCTPLHLRWKSVWLYSSPFRCPD